MKTRTQLIGFVAALAVSAGLVANAAETGASADVKVLIERGEALAKKGAWKAAKEHFIDAVNANENDPVAVYDLGIAQAHLGDNSGALSSMRRAIELRPDFAAAYTELGWLLSRQGELKAAREAEQKALGLDPDNSIAKRNLAAIEMAIQQQDRRLAAARAARLAPTSAERTKSPANFAKAERLSDALSRGRESFNHGKLDSAKTSFEQAVSLAPESPLAHANLGVVLGTMGDTEGQLREAKIAAAHDAKDAYAFTALAWAQGRRGEWESALQNYQKAISLKPTLLEAQIGQGMALYFSGKKEAGTAALKVLVSEHPTQASVRLAMGCILKESGKLAEAEKELKYAAKAMPTSAEAKLLMASLYLESGKLMEAQKLYKEAISLAPGSAAAHAGLSLTLHQMGNPKEAQAAAEKALELNPKQQIAQAVIEQLGTTH